MWPYALTLTPEANTTLWNAATRDLHCLPFNNAGDRGAPFKLHNELGETLMNAIKIALLGTAALAAVSVSARADDLADLKAQIEALNGRISQLEASPSVPAGYQLLSVTKADAIVVPSLDRKSIFFADSATTIGILPTADVPASTNIQWSGSVAAGIVFDRSKSDTVLVTFVGAPTTTTTLTTFSSSKTKAVDVRAKARLGVTATTDTAVGLVGVKINLQANANTAGAFNKLGNAVTDDGYWGWWQITPELTLGGGVAGSLAGNGRGFDGKATAVFAGGDGNGGYNHAGGDPAQIRLSYASGPMGFGIALEDGDNAANKSGLGVAGEVTYAGDSVGFELNAGYWNRVGGTANISDDDNWTVNAGANIALGDIASLSLAAGVGEDSNLVGNFDRYTKASAHLGFTLSDSVKAEFGASWRDYKGTSAAKSVGTGIYYTHAFANFQKRSDQLRSCILNFKITFLKLLSLNFTEN